MPSQLDTLRPLAGVRIVDLERHGDGRGSLLAFTDTAPLPFVVRHAYFIVDCPPDAVRAGHAISSPKALVAVCAGVTVDMDNGIEQQSFRLSGPDKALVIGAGVWLRLREFDERTAIAVFASQVHAEMTYYDQPVPALVARDDP